MGRATDLLLYLGGALLHQPLDLPPQSPRKRLAADPQVRRGTNDRQRGSGVCLLEGHHVAQGGLKANESCAGRGIAAGPTGSPASSVSESSRGAMQSRIARAAEGAAPPLRPVEAEAAADWSREADGRSTVASDTASKGAGVRGLGRAPVSRKRRSCRRSKPARQPPSSSTTVARPSGSARTSFSSPRERAWSPDSSLLRSRPRWRLCSLWSVSQSEVSAQGAVSERPTMSRYFRSRCLAAALALGGRGPRAGPGAPGGDRSIASMPDAGSLVADDIK